MYNGNKEVYDRNITRLFPNSLDGFYVSISMFILVTTFQWLNIFPLKYKGKIYGMEMGENIQSNTYIFKTMNNLSYHPEKVKHVVKFKKNKDLEEKNGDVLQQEPFK